VIFLFSNFILTEAHKIAYSSNYYSFLNSNAWTVVDIARYWSIFSSTTLSDLDDKDLDWKILLRGRSEEAFLSSMNENNEVISQTAFDTIFQSDYNIVSKCAANYTSDHQFQSFVPESVRNASQIEQFPPPAIAPGSFLLDSTLSSSPTSLSVHNGVEQSIVSDPQLIRINEKSVSIVENR